MRGGEPGGGGAWPARAAGAGEERFDGAPFTSAMGGFAPARREPDLQVSLPVVDNNRKVVGALSVVGEAPPKNKNGCWKQ